MERPKEFMQERRKVTVNGNELTAHMAAVLGHQLVVEGVDTNRAELRLAPGADTQELLAAAAGRLRVLRFEVVAPSLEEVFLEAVGEPSAEEAA